MVPTPARRPRRRSLALAPSLLGALVVAVASVPLSAGPVAAAWRDYIANCDVNLRTSTSISAKLLETIPAGSVVTTSNELAGGSWSANCPYAKAGSRWYAIVKINGANVLSLFGVSPVYAAKDLFRGANVLEGIDVSMWQGTMDFNAVKASGRSFVVAKATEGGSYLDPTWAHTKAAAMAAGLAVTGYHYARPDLNPDDPTGEADWFVSKLGLTPGMLVPALDLEVSGGLSTTKLVSWVKAFLDEVYAKTGARAMIYVSPGFWSGHMGDTRSFADAGYTILWVAHWYVNTPSVPAQNWGGHGWTFWQYDDCGTVPGIGGCVDLDRFNGTDLSSVTYGSGFDLDATPDQQSIEQGASASMAVSLVRSYFTLPISVSVSGLPTGMTASVSTSPTSGSSAAVGLKTSATGTPTGSYPITVTASADGMSQTTTTTVTVTDGLAPTVKGGHQWLFAPTAIGTGTPARTTWSGTDASGVASFALERQVDGGGWSAVGLSSAKATSLLEGLAFGHRYQDRIAATDKLGNTSDWVYGPILEPLVAQQADAGIGYHGTWASATNRYASGGSLRYTTTRGAYVTYSFSGMGFSWVSYRGPNRGSATVYVDGLYRGTVNLYASRYVARQVVFAMNWSTNASHTVKIVAQGTAGHPRVDVDAFVRVVRF